MDCKAAECKAKKRAIIQATMELVSENGFHGAPMAMVAERAGVAAGTIYRYFNNKDDLITGVYRDLEDRLHEQIRQGYPEKGSAREKFAHLARVLVTQWISSPVEFSFIEQFHNSPYGVALRRDRLFGTEKGFCWEILSEALEAGQVKELPVPMLFGLAFGPLIYISRDHILGFFQLDDPKLQQVIDGCWNAIKSE